MNIWQEERGKEGDESWEDWSEWVGSEGSHLLPVDPAQWEQVGKHTTTMMVKHIINEQK